ncbi:hypothetical protein ACLOAU_02555 [Niabella sp. CJ426]|uniref:hypothetical protein n=1 Tax=Niabella sp. CJ426 TaxID=3393740 RepID=UPI003CFD46ED
MRTTLLALAILLGNTISWAGVIDYKKYSELVNQAELKIIDSKYGEALEIYNLAFDVKENPFAADLYNASICAAYVGKLDASMALCKKLAVKGVGSNFFKNVSAYSKLHKHREWNSNMIYAKNMRDSILRKNKNILMKIDSLVIRDQLVNHVWRESGMATKERDMMYLTGDTISHCLKSMFESRGFLSEDIIGPPLNESGLLSTMLPFDVIMVHNYQSRQNGDTVFTPSLRKALINGEISPDYYATIQDMGTNNGSRPYYGTVKFYFQYKCKLLLTPYNKQRKETIDSNRASIGLCSTDDLLKKVVYRISNPGTEFKITAQLSILGSYADKESEELALKENIVMVDNIPNCTNLE